MSNRNKQYKLKYWTILEMNKKLQERMSLCTNLVIRRTTQYFV